MSIKKPKLLEINKVNNNKRNLIVFYFTNMEAFQQYDNENPIIWKQFKKTALKTISKGFKNYSSKSIFEVIRWHRGGGIKKDGFKINNNYTAYYARKFMDMFPEHEGFFRTRKVKKQ